MRSQQTIRAGIDRIRLVQVSDFKVGTVASSQRLVPGDGDIPIARILDVVLDAGYEGVFDLELIGDAIVAEGYDAAVPRAVERARRDPHERSTPERGPAQPRAGPIRSAGRRGPTRDLATFDLGDPREVESGQSITVPCCTRSCTHPCPRDRTPGRRLDEALFEHRGLALPAHVPDRADERLAREALRLVEHVHFLRGDDELVASGASRGTPAPTSSRTYTRAGR